MADKRHSQQTADLISI